METLKRWFQKKEEVPTVKLGVAPNPRRMMPYGDLTNDGAIQLSFTLPVDCTPEAKEAARLYIEKQGLTDVHVASAESIGAGYTFCVVFARAKHAIDFTKVKVPKADFQAMDYDSVMRYAEDHLKRRVVIVGATTGHDAHTVGLDAILNMKGYNGDPGLERYPCFKVHNLRSQVENAQLVERAVELKADVLMVSKLVTQRGQHLNDLKELVALVQQNKKLGSHLLKIIGGPRLTHAQATKLGFDAGFGPGTTPSEVASFIVQEGSKRIK